MFSVYPPLNISYIREESHHSYPPQCPSTWQSTWTLTAAPKCFWMTDWQLMNVKLGCHRYPLCCSWSSVSVCVLIKHWRKFQSAHQVRVSALWVVEIWLRNWPNLDESDYNRYLGLRGCDMKVSSSSLRLGCQGVLKEMFAGQSKVIQWCFPNWMNDAMNIGASESFL